MVMARRKPGYVPPNDFAEGSGFFDRLNRKLFPWIGPPPLGPYDQPAPVPAAERPCPLCGAPMAQHTRGDNAGRTMLRCPAPASETAPETAPEPSPASE